MPRIVVTGAGGFLGNCLVRHLALLGHEVVAFGRSAESLDALKGEHFTIVVCDLADAAAQPAPGISGRVDAIVHCAGLSSNWGPRSAFERDNVDATANLLDLARAWGTPHFVHVSSASVYFSFCDQLDVHETFPLPTPVNNYAWSKVAAEELVRAASDFPTTIVRPRGIYGRGDRALLPRLLRAAASGPIPLFRGGRAVIDLTHVDDVAAAIACILDHGDATAGVTYNVSGGEAVSIHDLILRSAKLAGIDVQWRNVSWPVGFAAVRAVEAFHQVFRPAVEPVVTAYSAGLLAFSQTLNLHAIRNDIGWRPAISFDEGLRRTFSDSVSA